VLLKFQGGLKMAICDGFIYHLVELLGLPDAENSIILKAQIDDIDRVNNTADISYVTTCDPPLTGTAVPFWFHCEFSSGTLEDLEYGHLSFKTNDLVYVIHFPAIGTAPNDLEERTYIVGHADMQFTRTCINEILEITQDGYGILVDIGKREIFDIDAFNERLGIDPENPPAPAPDPPLPLPPPEYSCVRDGQTTTCRFPAYMDAAYVTWRAAYFESSEDIPKSVTDSGFVFGGTIGVASGGTSINIGSWDTAPASWGTGASYAAAPKYTYSGTVDTSDTYIFAAGIPVVEYETENYTTVDNEYTSTGFLYGSYRFDHPARSFLGVSEDYFPEFKGIVESATGKFYGIGYSRETTESAAMDAVYAVWTGEVAHTHEILSSLTIFKTGIHDDVVLENGRRDSVVLWSGDTDYSFSRDYSSEYGWAWEGIPAGTGYGFSNSGVYGPDLPTFMEWDRSLVPLTKHEIVGVYGAYYIYGMVAEMREYDFGAMVSGASSDMSEGWYGSDSVSLASQVGVPNELVPLITVEAGATDHITESVLAAPFSVFAPLKDVGATNPIPLKNCLDNANKEICNIIDLAIIYLAKYVFANEGFGDGTFGAREHPSLAVYALKDEYV
jgi:hypothetical protein